MFIYYPAKQRTKADGKRCWSHQNTVSFAVPFFRNKINPRIAHDRGRHTEAESMDEADEDKQEDIAYHKIQAAGRKLGGHWKKDGFLPAKSSKDLRKQETCNKFPYQKNTWHEPWDCFWGTKAACVFRNGGYHHIKDEWTAEHWHECKAEAFGDYGFFWYISTHCVSPVSGSACGEDQYGLPETMTMRSAPVHTISTIFMINSKVAACKKRNSIEACVIVWQTNKKAYGYAGLFLLITNMRW